MDHAAKSGDGDIMARTSDAESERFDGTRRHDPFQVAFEALIAVQDFGFKKEDSFFRGHRRPE